MLVGYKVLRSEYQTTLAAMLLEAAKEGWQLVGGVSVTQGRDFGFTYFQAVAKYA